MAGALPYALNLMPYTLCLTPYTLHLKPSAIKTRCPHNEIADWEGRRVSYPSSLIFNSGFIIHFTGIGP
jgi:hypothetical protein